MTSSKIVSDQSLPLITILKLELDAGVHLAYNLSDRFPRFTPKS